MRGSLDKKSVAAGFFAGAALVAAMGAMQVAFQEGEVGRFSIAAAATDASEYCYVVDTKTGEVWKERFNGAWNTPKLRAER